MTPDPICRKKMGKFDFSSPHTNRSLLYILEFGLFSQTLYCINIFVNNRDQGIATFLTLNTTCMRK
jgi:hypothetical protein